MIERLVRMSETVFQGKIYKKGEDGDNKGAWEYIWKNAFDIELSNKVIFGSMPQMKDVDSILYAWANSRDGWGEISFSTVLKMYDGRHASCVGWSDTTGFECEGQIDWCIRPTLKEIIRFGLDKESRNHLGLVLDAC